MTEGHTETTGWHSAPLAFALLPALGGLLFQNGSAVVTDVMLLGLAGIFLNWSVRVPWYVFFFYQFIIEVGDKFDAQFRVGRIADVLVYRDWYHSARGLRVNEETYNDSSIIDDEESDNEGNPLAASAASLSSVPEDPSSDSPIPPTAPRHAHSKPHHHASESATTELYTHELLALLACFLSPLLGAYLLHTIRSSLSRPSEGLVNNYNLTIFLMASEMRPLSHLVKLIQARTLHLQRVVATNPYLQPPAGDASRGNSGADVPALLRRVQDLESTMSTVATSSALKATTSAEGGASSADASSSNKRDYALAVAEVRKTLQPELDALNRAVRRYEKRATLQTMQNEARLRELEGRVGDAVSLAAAATRGRGGVFGGSGFAVEKSFLSILVEWCIVWPLQGLLAVMSLPFKMVGALIEVGRRVIVGSKNSNTTYNRRIPDGGRGIKSSVSLGKSSGVGGAGYRIGGERVKVGSLGMKR